MNSIRILGCIAGFMTTISFLPQVIKIYKTKHTKDLSLPMFAIFSIGVVLWTLYGIVLKEPPIIIANFVVLILALYILIMKIKYK